MPARNPRVNVVLERPLYEALGRVARIEGTSLSTKARDLLRDALELREDSGLVVIADERAATLNKSAGMSHGDVWRRGTRRRRR